MIAYVETIKAFAEKSRMRDLASQPANYTQLLNPSLFELPKAIPRIILYLSPQGY